MNDEPNPLWSNPRLGQLPTSIRKFDRHQYFCADDIISILRKVRDEYEAERKILLTEINRLREINNE